MSFENLNLHPTIIKAVLDAGYTSPTPIQQQAIPELIAGHDVMASAQTGTGKTAAFMLPALHRLTVPAKIRSRGPRILVLTPTRELALQVSEATNKYGKFLSRVNVVSILGGMPYPLQNKLLSRTVDILVATPGRLIDHIERGRIDFSRLEMLILDEADRMLDMGFIQDVERIAAKVPANRQTLLFSATLDNTIEKIAAHLLNNPKRIQITPQRTTLNHIEQRMHYVDDLSHKNRLLDHLLCDTTIKQAIIFTATKRSADSLADNLSAQGHKTSSLHGDMSQRERTRTLTGLRRGRLKILVATDVAARGIDVADITHVINFDLPKFAEDYVHRIGRTGRAGTSGIAISFAASQDLIHLRRIERFTGNRFTFQAIPGIEPRTKPRFGNNSDRSARKSSSTTHKTKRSWANNSHKTSQNTKSYGKNEFSRSSPARTRNTRSQGRSFRSDGFSNQSNA